MLLQGRVLCGSADELSPESEERSGGSQSQHAGVYRDGQNPAGSQKPGIRRGEIGDSAVIMNLMLEFNLRGKRNHSSVNIFVKKFLSFSVTSPLQTSNVTLDKAPCSLKCLGFIFEPSILIFDTIIL